MAEAHRSSIAAGATYVLPHFKVAGDNSQGDIFQVRPGGSANQVADQVFGLSVNWSRDGLESEIHVFAQLPSHAKPDRNADGAAAKEGIEKRRLGVAIAIAMRV